MFPLSRIPALLSLAVVALAAQPAVPHPADEHPYVAAADREYAALFSHPDNPCKDLSSTVSYEICIGKEVSFTETHLAAFLTAVRGITAADDQAPPPSEAFGPRHELALLNQADAAWRIYRNNLCDLAYAGLEGGTGAASVQAECEYRTDREYARQLAAAVELATLAK